MFDVAVVGVGPAGCVAASILAQGGAKVALVGREDVLLSRIGEHLPAITRHRIDALNILPADWTCAHFDVTEFISRWERGPPVEQNSIFSLHGPALTLDRNRFDDALYAAAISKGANAIRVRAHAIEDVSQAWLISAEGKGTETVRIVARTIVLCCGRSGLRGPWATKKRRLDRLVCFGLRARNYGGDARPSVETYRNGWAYTAPLPGDELMVNIATEALGKRRVEKSLDFILGEIAHCELAGRRLMSCVLTSKEDMAIFAVSAASTITRPAVGSRWALAGDNAQTFDPLSSQGISQAIDHAERIAHAILHAESELPDFSNYAQHLDDTVDAYLKTRKKIYSRAMRWESPFWQNRSERSAAC